MRIEDLEEPEWSLEMIVRARLSWRLVSGADGRLVAQKEIDTKFKATPDHEAAVEARGRFAIEHAVRENVALGVKWVAEVEATAAGN